MYPKSIGQKLSSLGILEDGKAEILTRFYKVIKVGYASEEAGAMCRRGLCGRNMMSSMKPEVRVRIEPELLFYKSELW